MKNAVDWKGASQFSGPEQSPGFLLWQISTQWRRQIETALSALGLTHTQFVLLASVGWLVKEGNAVSQVEVARHCKTDITMTSQVLRTLEKKGYIERSHRQGNERSKFSSITEAGRQLIEEALPLVETVDREFFGKLEKDTEKCVEILQKLISQQIG